MYPHRIRLRDPWQHAALTDPPDHARSLRHFGYPGHLDAHERVWLTLAGVAGPAEVSLNGTRVGRGTGDFEFEITPLLRPRNELILQGPGGHGGVAFSEVALEVRATAFLRHIRAFLHGQEVVATGEVVGHAAGPLDLYLVLDRTPAAYAAVAASPGGTPFRLGGSTGDAGTESPRFAKIELVQGAVKWYTVEVDLRQAGTQGPGV